MRVPSGDQRGDVCEPAPLTSGHCLPVATSISQIDGRDLSVITS